MAKNKKKRLLNDRTLRALKPAKAGQRYEVPDALTPGLVARVTDKGTKTFALVARYPGSPNPTRRALGEYGAIGLAEAREKARQWHVLLAKGIDPGEQEERARLAEQQKRENGFASVAEAFIADKLPSERKGKEVARDIRRDLGGIDPETKKPIGPLAKRPITEITDLDILAVIKAKKLTAPAQARNLLGIAKRLFRWAKDQRCYGLAASPCADIKASSIIGKKKRGERTLSDQEVFALWRAAKRMPYPRGPVYQMLALTALRLNEAADASLPEFDPALVHVLRTADDKDIADRLRQLPAERKVWIIPAERMKGRDGEARPHAVPLTDAMLDIMATLRRFKKGKFLFSTTFGESPVWIGDKIKKEIDGRMLLTLRALARKRGEDPQAVELKPWVNHDIRRTVRSNLSRLKVTEEAREAVMAHARPGIKGTYDLYDYLDEKREALTLWAARLRSIVEPPPENVVSIKRA